MSEVLLDTNAFIRMIVGQEMRPNARRLIAESVAEGRLWISAVTGWEIALLTTRSRTGRLLEVEGQVSVWFDRVVERTRLRHLPLEAVAAMESVGLPEPFHKDPADRFLVAQARAHELTLVTRDRAILDYAAAGHVRAVPC